MYYSREIWNWQLLKLGKWAGKLKLLVDKYCVHGYNRQALKLHMRECWNGRQARLRCVCPMACEFESHLPHHIGTQVLIRYLRSFSFYQNPLGTRLFGTFASEIRFIVSKLNTQKSKLSDSNLPNI